MDFCIKEDEFFNSLTPEKKVEIASNYAYPKIKVNNDKECLIDVKNVKIEHKIDR